MRLAKSGQFDKLINFMKSGQLDDPRCFWFEECDGFGETHHIYTEVYDEEIIDKVYELSRLVDESPLRKVLKIKCVSESPSFFSDVVINGYPYEQKRKINKEKLTQSVNLLNEGDFLAVSDIVYQAGLFEH